MAIEPRAWQRDALPLWRKDMRGIVAAVTGSGKTTFALLCARDFLARQPAGSVFVVVPTIPLLDQWTVAIEDELGVAREAIGTIAAGKKLWKGKQFVIAVINSARDIASDVTKHGSTMLIADECHRAGSERNAKVFKPTYAATLGLSATPERQYDDGFEKYIRPALGEVIFEYGYDAALKDGVIVPFRLVNIGFPLSRGEQTEYSKLTRRVAVLLKRAKHGTSEHVANVLRRRARVSWNSRLRAPIAVKLVLKHKEERIVLFHESVDQANEIYRLLNDCAVRTTIYHTGIDPVTRRENLRLFRSGYYSCIVSCRALDEGLNVPNVTVGIIASSTGSIRQRIQRLGRVLRKAANKETALIYTLYATKVEKQRLQEEAKKLFGVSDTRWLETKVQLRG